MTARTTAGTTAAAHRRVRVRVPASTANLGSGFDALGLALGRHDTVDVEVTDGGLTVEVTGEGADEVPTDERHLVVRALRAAAERIGLDLPGIALTCDNTIPQARGLGSSAAAVVAGVVAAYAVAGRGAHTPADAAEMVQLAAEFEGHADNVAACLLGGLAVAWQEGDRFRALTLPAHPALRPVVLIPLDRSETHVTRGLLPDRVPHIDAAFAAGRCALAVQAITARPDLLLPATEDRLHQDYRAKAWPATIELVSALRSSGVAATVSGAGPTVFVATVDGVLPESVDLTGFAAHELPVDAAGAQVRTTD
jgi:homoserine kinase